MKQCKRLFFLIFLQFLSGRAFCSADTFLKVVNCPEKNLAYSNIVYFSDGDLDLKKMIEINGMTYVIESHPDINPNQIGMSRTQRISSSVSLGDEIKVQQISENMDDLKDLVLKVDLLRRHDKERLAEVSEKIVSDFLAQSQFIDIPLTKGQSLIYDFKGVPIVFTVDLCKPNKGVFRKNTNIILEPGRKILSSWKLKKKIFRKNINLENMRIGGLDKEFANIFRRAFMSRMLPPRTIEEFGMSHVKGILLYGPPGTGKTLMAREIASLLMVTPKIVDGPSILNKYVGESEKQMRELFADAEADDLQGDDSKLHVIIFDEIDAICKSRSSTGSSTGVESRLVNQLLSKMDGVKSINNVLVIAMTNRKDMLDPALLRPGRFEVQVEVGLPDQKGREDILKIHTATLRRNGLLASNVSLEEIAALTKNFTGAEIAGLVRSAVSIAFEGVDVSNPKKIENMDFKHIKVSEEHFLDAFNDITPAFGTDVENLGKYLRRGLVSYGDKFEHILSECKDLMCQSQRTFLIEGPDKCGKTALAVKLALDSKSPYIRMISPELLVNKREDKQCDIITNIFRDGYKSPKSIIILDDIGGIIQYSYSGPRFSNKILQTLKTFLKKIPENKDAEFTIIGTSSELPGIRFRNAFDRVICIQKLEEDDIISLLTNLKINLSEEEKQAIAATCAPVAIKNFFLDIEKISKLRACGI